MKVGPVAAIVLAAGSSRRMGRNKLLLDLAGETVVRRTVRSVVTAGLHPVVVVLGHEEERVRAEIADLPCRTVVNPRHTEGAATSLAAGVAAVPEEVAALVVVLADMPFVTAAMLRTLVERHHATGAPVVVSRYGDVEAPPPSSPAGCSPSFCPATATGAHGRWPVVIGRRRPS